MTTRGVAACAVMLAITAFTSGVSVLFQEHQSKLQFNYLWDVQTKGRNNELRAQYQAEF